MGTNKMGARTPLDMTHVVPMVTSFVTTLGIRTEFRFHRSCLRRIALKSANRIAGFLAVAAA